MKVSIPNECKVDQSSFSRVEKGEYCKVCKKTVFDFTKQINISIEEVECGIFRKRDVINPFGDWRDFYVNNFQQLSFVPKKSFSVSLKLFLVGMVLFVSGCNRRIKGAIYHPTKREVKKMEQEHSRKEIKKIEAGNCNPQKN